MARVNRLIQTTLAEIIPTVKDPRLVQTPALSVVEVKTSPDLHQAKVYLAVGGEKKDQLAVVSALNKAQGFLRSELGHRIRLRFTPELHFVLDETAEKAAHLEQIFQELANERKNRENTEREIEDQPGTDDTSNS